MGCTCQQNFRFVAAEFAKLFSFLYMAAQNDVTEFAISGIK